MVDDINKIFLFLQEKKHYFPGILKQTVKINSFKGFSNLMAALVWMLTCFNKVPNEQDDD